MSADAVPVVCAWCSRLRVAEEWVEACTTRNGSHVSHGLCPTCRNGMIADMLRLTAADAMLINRLYDEHAAMALHGLHLSWHRTATVLRLVLQRTDAQGVVRAVEVLVDRREAAAARHDTIGRALSAMLEQVSQ